MSTRRAGRGATLVASLIALGAAGEAAAAGRWYAWLDRVPAGLGADAAARWNTRGVPARVLPSERLFGMEPGFVYLVAFESLFQADAQAYVERLHGGGFRSTGVQYFSDALPAGAAEALGTEPTFAVEAPIDAGGPPELVALTRTEQGDTLKLLARHADGTLSVEATHPARLYDLPRVTEGERVRVFPLGPAPTDGTAVVFEAAFNDPLQQSVWSLVFAFRTQDLRVPPLTILVPGARTPVPVRVDFASTPAGLTYTVTVEGLPGGPRVRRMRWHQDRFVDADASPAQGPGGAAHERAQ